MFKNNSKFFHHFINDKAWNTFYFLSAACRKIECSRLIASNNARRARTGAL